MQSSEKRTILDVALTGMKVGEDLLVTSRGFKAIKQRLAVFTQSQPGKRFVVNGGPSVRLIRRTR